VPTTRSIPSVAPTLAQLGRGAHALPIRSILLTLIIASALYGGVMGSWEVHEADRWKLVLFGMVKMPLLVVATTLVCLPGFVVLNNIAGVRDDLPLALRTIIGSQAAFALSLLSLAPITRLLYFCRLDQPDAVVINAVMFTLATAVAQVVIFRGYHPLRKKNPAHGYLTWTWLILYAFVGIEMGWMLRPFIGGLDRAPTFLREEPFSNAYVVVATMLTRVIGM
jgi:hypothetical protein